MDIALCLFLVEWKRSTTKMSRILPSWNSSAKKCLGTINHRKNKQVRLAGAWNLQSETRGSKNGCNCLKQICTKKTCRHTKPTRFSNLLPVSFTNPPLSVYSKSSKHRSMSNQTQLVPPSNFKAATTAVYVNCVIGCIVTGTIFVLEFISLLENRKTLSLTIASKRWRIPLASCSWFAFWVFFLDGMTVW